MSYWNQREYAFVGRLTLSTFLKIGLFIGLGSSLVGAAFYGISALIRIVTGNIPPINDYGLRVLYSIAIMPLASLAGSLLSALVAYPVYVWICGRRGGHIVRGIFRVGDEQEGS